MRYRALTPTGDMTFGAGAANYLVNSPAAVAQAVLTRLLLRRGEWFLDITEGTPWATEVLGTGTSTTWDRAIRSRILGTEGVTDIESYSSTKEGRSLSIRAVINTRYGQASVEAVL